MHPARDARESSQRHHRRFEDKTVDDVHFRVISHDRRPEVARHRFDIVLARGRMQDRFEDDPDRIGERRRRVGHPRRKIAQTTIPRWPPIGRAASGQQSKCDEAQRENARERHEHVRRRHRKHHGIALSAAVQNDEAAPRERVLADLRAKIVELGDKGRRKIFLTLLVAVEEGRNQSGGGAFVCQRSHGAVDYRNDISRQDPEQNACGGKQGQWRKSALMGLCGVSCAFRPRHAEKAHGVDLGEAGDREAGGKGQERARDRKHDLDRRRRKHC